MEPVKPGRDERTPTRARSRATRMRITKAATSLFRDRGYTRTTMADIAQAAGVAVQTVYFVCHPNTEVFTSAYGWAGMGEDEPAVPQEQAWYRQAVAEPDVTAAVPLGVGGLGAVPRPLPAL